MLSTSTKTYHPDSQQQTFSLSLSLYFFSFLPAASNNSSELNGSQTAVVKNYFHFPSFLFCLACSRIKLFF
jgi:hypothetical protein